MGWKWPHGCQPPAKAEFQCWVRSPKPFPVTTEQYPELEFAQNSRVEHVPHTCAELFLLQYVDCCLSPCMCSLEINHCLFCCWILAALHSAWQPRHDWHGVGRQLCYLVSISTAKQATRKVHATSSALQATFKARTCFPFPFNFRRLAVCTADCSLRTALQPCRALLAWRWCWEEQHSAREQEPQPAARGPQGNCGTCSGVWG